MRLSSARLRSAWGSGKIVMPSSSRPASKAAVYLRDFRKHHHPRPARHLSSSSTPCHLHARGNESESMSRSLCEVCLSRICAVGPGAEFVRVHHYPQMRDGVVRDVGGDDGDGCAVELASRPG